MKKIKFAVIGAGHIGKRHINVIQKNSEADLCAIIDTNPKNELANELSGIPFFNSLTDFFNASIDLDIITVATPNHCHYQHGMESLSNYVNVLIEKPLALTSIDAEKLIIKAREVQREIFTVKQLRYSPVVKWLKNTIDNNLLGKIYLVQLNCLWNRDERYYTPNNWHGKKNTDGGTLFTQFSHFIDMLNWIFGDISNIQSKFLNLNHKNLIEFEDTGFITFDIVKGGTGCFNYTTSVWEKNLESSITIVAEKGTIKIGGQYLNTLAYCDVKDYSLSEDDIYSFNQPFNVNSYHTYLIQNVIDILKKKPGSKNIPSEDIKVIDIIERMYGSNKNI